MFAQTSESRVHWLHAFRLGIAGLGLALLLLAIEGRPQPARLPYAIVIGACLLSLLYTLIERRITDHARFATAQVVVDTLLVSALVYLTGGVYSFAALLYFGAVLAASLCVSQQLSFLVASGATVALAAIQIGYHLAAAEPAVIDLPFVGSDFIASHRLRLGRDTAYLIAHCLALHMVAVLGAYLSREIQHVRILYSEILEKMAEGLVVIDARHRIVFVNNEARRLLGYGKPDSVIGLDFRHVFRRRQDREVLDCLLGPEQVAVEIDVTTRSGVRAFEVKTTVLRDERGVTRGTIGIFTDLTLRRRIEDTERRAERLEELTTLALGIAHEVRNPLASIRGCVQELGRHEFLGEDDQQLVRIVCRESDRLDTIVGDFMEFAKLRPPMRAPTDLARLLGDAAVLLRNRDGAAPAAIDLDVPDGAEALVDAAQLQQVFMNLGLNAIEAMAGRGRLSISLRPARVPLSRYARRGKGLGRRLLEVDGFEVRFEDSGPGMGERELQQVFVPFYTTKQSGTGLGLPVAERIVKAHEGEIVVTSRLGEGTCFAVRLPQAAPGDDGEADEAADGGAQGRRAPGDGAGDGDGDGDKAGAHDGGGGAQQERADPALAPAPSAVMAVAVR